MTAAYLLTQRGEHPLVLEKDVVVGGISRTVVRDGWRFDLGGHRFFTKVPEVAALWDRIQTEFRENQRRIVASIAEKGALRPDLDIERAADILWTINHGDLWQHLVVRRGWSPEQFERWLADTFQALLLS